ncbi:MAG: TlpA family protein disulfide reductase [Alphaproteobacteria bacterium]|nr:TlpA family protein disulfide reductase [Alphaproteobacteria bacterium]
MRTKPLVTPLLITAILCGAMAFVFWPQAEAPSSPPGFAAPSFTWQTFDGKSSALKDSAGRATVLHFWASWCAPCKAEFPLLMQAVKQNPDIIFLALSSDSDRGKAEKFLAEMGATPAPTNLLLGWDKDKKITYDLFMTVAYPETIILDKQHRLRRKIPGVAEWQSKELQAYLRQLQKE